MEELLDHTDQTVERLLDSQENLADPLDRATVESDQDASHQGQRKYVDQENPRIFGGYREY